MAPRTPSGSASICLTLISQNNVSPQDPQHVLARAFDAKDYPDRIRNLLGCGIDPQEYIDGLDRILAALRPGSEIYCRGLRALRKTCGIYGLLPASHAVADGLRISTVGKMKRPFASGGYSDLWRAEDDGGRIFAVKQLRIYEVDNFKRVKKNYCKEIIICKRIRHENVLSIEGIAPGMFELCVVSKWMESGNILQYVDSHPGVDRMHLLTGVARGLAHLHLNEVVHGGLKGSNVLIDQGGNPLLADFGLSSITTTFAPDGELCPETGGRIRWSPPELLNAFSGGGKRRKPTTKSDIYALSMVVVELFSGNIPFFDIPDPTVILMVSRGERPPKPASAEMLGLTSAVWELTKRCWHKKAAKRPDARDIVAFLEGMVAEVSPSFLRRATRFFHLLVSPRVARPMGSRD